jgi:hypothetical protein
MSWIRNIGLQDLKKRKSTPQPQKGERRDYLLVEKVKVHQTFDAATKYKS